MTASELNQIATVIGKAVSNAVVLRQKELLTLDEAEQYTGLTKSYLYKLTSNKVIPHFKPNGKMIYIKREVLDEWMMSNPVASETELNSKAQAYCTKNKRK